MLSFSFYREQKHLGTLACLGDCCYHLLIGLLIYFSRLARCLEFPLKFLKIFPLFPCLGVPSRPLRAAPALSHNQCTALELIDNEGGVYCNEILL